MEELAIIILNYNSANEVIRQIKEINVSKNYKNNFFIVDNNSLDSNILEIFCQENGIFFKNMQSNKGYAFANNWAIRKAIERGFTYSLILNPDIHITDQTILSLKKQLDNNDNLVVIGPRLCYKENPNIIFSDGGLLYPDKGFEGDHVNYLKDSKDVFEQKKLNTEIDYVNGSAMMFKNSIIKDVDYMNEDLFMYYEESEWCYRIKCLTSKQIGVLTTETAYQTDSSRGGFYEYYMSRNRTWFCKKYKGNLKYLLYERYKFLERKIKDKNLSKKYKIEVAKSTISGIWNGLWMKVSK